MEPQSKKNQVKHGKYGSVLPPAHFPLEAIIIGSYPWQEGSSLNSWNLPTKFSIIYRALNCKGL